MIESSLMDALIAVAKALLALPVVAFAFVVDGLRRLPGARALGGLMPWVAGLLIVAAGVVLLAHATQKSPQRISIPDLAAGKLSNLQSWIIVSGRLTEQRGSALGRRVYSLTDDRVPDVDIIVPTSRELAVGDTTISGTLQGSRPGPGGGAWTGRLIPDPVLATEPPPPWPAAALALAGVLVILARRTTYPMFFREAPGVELPRTANTQVLLRRTMSDLGERAVVPATLVIQGPGVASLHVTSERPLSLQLHSAHTAVDVGLLRGLRSAAPTLRVHASTEDVTISFGSRRERDAIFAALSTSLASRERPHGSEIRAS